MYSQQTSDIYLHSLMLQQRISQLDTEIRHAARKLAHVVNCYNIVCDAFGEDDHEALELEAMATDWLICLENLGSDYDYYTDKFDALLKEDATLAA